MPIFVASGALNKYCSRTMIFVGLRGTGLTGDLAMRLKTIALAALAALAATGAAAQSIGSQSWIPDLSGLYRCVQSCGGSRLVQITQHGWELDLTGEISQPAHAWIQRPGHIGTSWNDLGVYSPDGVTIQFSSGTVWVLVDPMPLRTPGL
jgi:hypothetical protein